MEKIVIKERNFCRWAEDVSLDDDDLCDAIAEMEHGLIDANLGGGVYKKRIALQGRGKRGGARTIIASNLGNRWIFLYGFAKGDKDNLTKNELLEAKSIATVLLNLPESHLLQLVIDRRWEKIICKRNQ